VPSPGGSPSAEPPSGAPSAAPTPLVSSTPRTSKLVGQVLGASDAPRHVRLQAEQARDALTAAARRRLLKRLEKLCREDR